MTAAGDFPNAPGACARCGWQMRSACGLPHPTYCTADTARPFTLEAATRRAVAAALSRMGYADLTPEQRAAVNAATRAWATR